MKAVFDAAGSVCVEIAFHFEPYLRSSTIFPPAWFGLVETVIVYFPFFLRDFTFSFGFTFSRT